MVQLFQELLDELGEEMNMKREEVKSLLEQIILLAKKTTHYRQDHGAMCETREEREHKDSIHELSMLKEKLLDTVSK